jgi:hypothetical protein
LASVRTLFKKRTPCHLPLSPCKRASYHTDFVAIILSTDENDQNKNPSCGKAITTSDSTWENSPLFYFTMTDILSMFPLNFIMSGLATNARNPSKRTQQGNNSGSAAVGSSATNGFVVGGGSAAPSNAAGNTNQAGN